MLAARINDGVQIKFRHNPKLGSDGETTWAAWFRWQQVLGDDTINVDFRQAKPSIATLFHELTHVYNKLEGIYGDSDEEGWKDEAMAYTTDYLIRILIPQFSNFENKWLQKNTDPIEDDSTIAGRVFGREISADARQAAWTNLWDRVIKGYYSFGYTLGNAPNKFHTDADMQTYSNNYGVKISCKTIVMYYNSRLHQLGINDCLLTCDNVNKNWW